MWLNDKAELLTDEKRRGSNSKQAAEKMETEKKEIRKIRVKAD